MGILGKSYVGLMVGLALAIMNLDANIVENKVEDIVPIISKYHEKLSIRCLPSNTSNSQLRNTATTTWWKDNKMLNENRSVLEISSMRHSDAGIYACTLTDKKSSKTLYSMHFQLDLIPVVWIRRGDDDQAYREKDKINITCHAKGFPVPIMKWKIENDTYEQSSGRIYLYEGNGINNSILVIKSANKTDRGYYHCFATNRAGTSNSVTMFIRVKGRLAALWPFLGIVVEVIILCTVIFVYERKRNQREEIEDDSEMDDQELYEDDMPSSPDQDSDHLRFRK